jgi:hypothetical protein
MTTAREQTLPQRSGFQQLTCNAPHDTRAGSTESTMNFPTVNPQGLLQLTRTCISDGITPFDAQRTIDWHVSLAKSEVALMCNVTHAKECDIAESQQRDLTTLPLKHDVSDFPRNNYSAAYCKPRRSQHALPKLRWTTKQPRVSLPLYHFSKSDHLCFPNTCSQRNQPSISRPGPTSKGGKCVCVEKLSRD